MRTEERVIGGFRYKMQQLGTQTGNQVLLRLSRPAAALYSVAAKRGGMKSINAEDVIGGLEHALRELQGRDLAYVVKKLAGKTEVYLPDGDKHRPWPLLDSFDAHFAGRYVAEMQWIRWGIELNAFFGDVLALFSGRGESTSPFPQASTGGNGVSSSAPG